MPFVTQVKHTSLLVNKVDGPYMALSQSVNSVIVSEDPSFATRLCALYEVTLIIDAPGDPLTPLIGQVAQEVIVSVQKPGPEPAFVTQVTQLELVLDAPPPNRVSGISSSALLLLEASRPVPALMVGVRHMVLHQEIPSVRPIQGVHTALIEEEKSVNGSIITQAAQLALALIEPASRIIVNQEIQTALITVQKPLNDTRNISTHHLALHVDISGITTLTALTGGVQLALIQQLGGEPTPNPERSRFQSFAAAMEADLKYSAHVQSASNVLFASEQTSLVKSYPRQVQSMTKVGDAAQRVAKRSTTFVDPSQIGSFVQSSATINAAALRITLQQPVTIHSQSVLRNIAHQIVKPAIKPNPANITSTEQIPGVVMQTTLHKQYGSPNVSSAALQRGSVLAVVVHKELGEIVQSNSVMKKTSRLISRTALFPTFDSIRSTTMIPVVSKSTSVQVTYKNPDDIRPILSLSGTTQSWAKSVIMTNPSGILSPLTVNALSQSYCVSKDFLPPQDILGTTLNLYATVKLVAKPKFYISPEAVEISRRDVYGTYYSELDNTN